MRLKNYISILYIGVLSSFFVRFGEVSAMWIYSFGVTNVVDFGIFVLFCISRFCHLLLSVIRLFVSSSWSSIQKNTGYLNSFQNNFFNMPRDIIVLSYPFKLFTTYNFINFIGDRCKSYLQFPTVFYILRGQNVKNIHMRQHYAYERDQNVKKKYIYIHIRRY